METAMASAVEQHHHDHELEDHDRGLVFDLATLDRRQVLKLARVRRRERRIVRRSPAARPTGSSAVGHGRRLERDRRLPASVRAARVIPEETAGPFPGDGSNGPDVLDQSGVVRKDIRSSFGSSTTTAPGVPLTINLTIQDAATCTPLASAAVYLWHCDRDGNYSLYSAAAANENYLRGVQAADANGLVTFTSIFPACYSGRWPHIHFEVYPEPGDGER